MRHTAISQDRRAAVSILFAAAAMPVIALASLSIDFAFVNQAKSELSLAADTAAMVATKIAASELAAHNTNHLTDGIQAGREWFKAESGSVTAFTSDGLPAATVQVSQTGTAFTSTVAYTGRVRTIMAGAFGISSIPIAGAATASINLDGFVNIAMLLDNSSSMLIGATTADINTLQAATPCSAAAPASGQALWAWTGPLPAACTNGQTAMAPCGFACHWSATGPDYYYLARNSTAGLPAGSPAPLGNGKAGVSLRFDLVQSATATVINTMRSDQVVTDQFGVSVFMFNSGFTQVYPSSGEAGTSLSLAATAVQQITTPVVANDGDTDFPDAMQALAQILTQGGDGSSASSPRKNLFIVTDGMQDYRPGSGGRTLAPFNTAAAISACNTIKAMNIAIYVLYTPYTALPYNPFYAANIAPLNQPDTTGTTPIESALQNCASSTADFYEASAATQITQAMNKMLQSALKAPARINS